jgi:tripartite-type tricarboxylate transporter receptor subunit TctC
MQIGTLTLASLAVLVALAPTPRANAQVSTQIWPQRPVKIIVPFAAGGNSDTIARLIAQRFGEVFGQQFVVENRGGAGGIIAAEAVARAPADGYTLFMGSPSQMTIAPVTTKIGYDPIKDFAPIGVIGANPLVLMVNAGTPGSSVAAFIDHVRKQPGKLPYGTAGIGSIAHLTAVMFLKRAGLEMIPVAYKGGSVAVPDIMAGTLTMYCANLSEALPHATSNQVRLLAITGETRTPQLPDVPTLAESALPGFKSVTWNGLVAPAGTPPDIIDRMSQEIARADKDPAFGARLSAIGVNPVGNTPAEFAAWIAADAAMWAEAADLAGVRAK